VDSGIFAWKSKANTQSKKKNTQFEKSGDDSTHVCAMKRLRAKSRSKVRGALAKVKPVKELLKSPKVTRT